MNATGYGAGSVVAVMREGLKGQLPERYGTGAHEPYGSVVRAAMRPGLSVLDAGAGRQPVVPAPDRPADIEYRGLDLSASELDCAPAGSYTGTTVGDLAVRHPDLAGRFDLVLCFQVLEHVGDVPAALDNLHAYLKPGGRLLAQLSGGWSVFAAANRLVPQRLAGSVMRMVRRGSPGHEMFPAHYHRCWDRALAECLRPWAEHEITPLYCGGWYLCFAPPLLSLYLGYEEWTLRRGHRDLASYYVLDARA